MSDARSAGVSNERGAGGSNARSAPPTVTVIVAGMPREVVIGTPLAGLFPPRIGEKAVLAARLDTLVVDLATPVLRKCRVEAVTYGTKEGNEVYRRTLTFLLFVAARRAFPRGHLVIGHSLSGGYYYDLEGEAPGGILRLAEELGDLILRDLPIEKVHFGISEAIDYFEGAGRLDKVRLLQRAGKANVEAYRLEGICDIPFGPLAPATGATPHFSLVPYPPGFVLRFPEKKDMTRMSPPSEQTRLFAVYHESKRWCRILGVENVGDLNEVIAAGGLRELIQVAEALHEKKIAQLSDSVAASPEVRLIQIAGPSSSGKTTFSKRLSVHLRVAGLAPHPLSLDNYFVDREKTPLDKDGHFDFEALGALDLDLLNEQLMRLLAGEEVGIPRYDFKSGRRIENAQKMRLDKDAILVLEGIHGLNEELTKRIPHERKRKIYVSALTQLTIDDSNRIPTTDTRLLRRIVRDRKYRGYRAIETIRRWPSVIRGEAKNIFPFQETADWMFNTALLYEMAVLKLHARRALEEVSPEETEAQEAHRLLDFLDLFLEVDGDAVPPTSILREFIGGSSFHY